jgi:hypothetical protein
MHRPSTPLISEAAFTAWLLHAHAGERLIYWRGLLATDASPLASQLPGHDRAELSHVSQLAWNMAQKGWVHLVQQRHGVNDFSYLAIARQQALIQTGGQSPLPMKAAA